MGIIPEHFLIKYLSWTLGVPSFLNGNKLNVVSSLVHILPFLVLSIR